jgi:hypothetical protein
VCIAWYGTSINELITKPIHSDSVFALSFLCLSHFIFVLISSLFTIMSGNNESSVTSLLAQLFQEPDPRLGQEWLDYAGGGWTEMSLH